MLEINNDKEISIIELVNTILIDAYKKKASNISFIPNKQITKVVFDIGGTSIIYTELFNSIMEQITNRIKIIAGINVIGPQNGTIKAVYEQKDINFYVSIHPNCYGQQIDIRVLVL